MLNFRFFYLHIDLKRKDWIKRNVTILVTYYLWCDMANIYQVPILQSCSALFSLSTLDGHFRVQNTKNQILVHKNIWEDTLTRSASIHRLIANKIVPIVRMRWTLSPYNREIVYNLFVINWCVAMHKARVIRPKGYLDLLSQPSIIQR